MGEYEDFKTEILKDPDVRKEYEALEAEYADVQAMIDAGREGGALRKKAARKNAAEQ